MWLRNVSLMMAATALVASGAVTSARHQTLPERPPGIYVVKADETAVRLVSQAAEVTYGGMGKAALTMGLSRPSAEARLFGSRADLRLPPGRTTFHLHLHPSGSTRDPMSFATASADLPMQVRRPNDIALVRLELSDAGDERVARLGGLGGNRPRDRVDLEVTRLAASVYALDATTPLAPGEYAFTILPAGAGAELWDFGVDAE